MPFYRSGVPGDVAWNSIGQNECKKLERLQKRAANIALLSSAADMEDLKWLSLISRRRMHTNCLTFKCLNGILPLFFKNYFNKRSGHYQTEAMVRISCYNVLEQKWQSAHFIILGPSILMNFLLVLEILNRILKL